MMSVFNIFQVITLEGWTEQMYTIRIATQSVKFDAFFVVIVIFGAFFVLNLMIAVQFSFLGDAFDQDEKERQQRKEKIIQSKKSHIGYVSDSDSSDDELEVVETGVEEE